MDKLSQVKIMIRTMGVIMKRRKREPLKRTIRMKRTKRKNLSPIRRQTLIIRSNIRKTLNKKTLSKKILSKKRLLMRSHFPLNKQINQ